MANAARTYLRSASRLLRKRPALIANAARAYFRHATPRFRHQCGDMRPPASDELEINKLQIIK